jgi:hypothetical protein
VSVALLPLVPEPLLLGLELLDEGRGSVTWKRKLGFEVLTAVTINSMVFWMVMPCSLEKAQILREDVMPSSWSKSKKKKKPAESGVKLSYF